MIPLSRPYIGVHERLYIDKALHSKQLSAGNLVRQFEERFASLVQRRHAVAVTSGTTALHLALSGIGIGPGDEVLVPDLTYVSTAAAVKYTGADVRLVDVDDTGCMDVVEATRVASERTVASMPVHLYGKSCCISELPGIIVEDAAESLGRVLPEERGAVECYSFYGNKILTTGEGGMVCCDEDGLAQELRHLRGMATLPGHTYAHDRIGFNYRMTELQAAVGCGQLDHFGDSLRRRTAVVNRYAEVLSLDWPAHAAPWLFAFRLPAFTDRDAIIARMLVMGIETRPVFTPLHRMTMFDGFAPDARRWEDSDFPRASEWSDRGICLPTYPELTIPQVDLICEELLKAIREDARP